MAAPRVLASLVGRGNMEHPATIDQNDILAGECEWQEELRQQQSQLDTLWLVGAALQVWFCRPPPTSTGTDLIR